MTLVNIREASLKFAKWLQEKPFVNRVQIESKNGVKVDLYWEEERMGVAFLMHKADESFVLYPDKKIWTATKTVVEATNDLL